MIWFKISLDELETLEGLAKDQPTNDGAFTQWFIVQTVKNRCLTGDFAE